MFHLFFFFFFFFLSFWLIARTIRFLLCGVLLLVAAVQRFFSVLSLTKYSVDQKKRERSRSRSRERKVLESVVSVRKWKKKKKC